MINELNVNNYNNGVIGNKMLLTEQDTAKILGIPKKSVQDLIASGMLQGIPTNGKTYVSRNALAEMLGEKSSVNFGQHACGQTLTSTVYYGQQTFDCEDDSMLKQYKGSISALKDGDFMVQIDMGKTPAGKRIRPSKRFKNRGDAERYLRQRLFELNGPEVSQPVAASYDAAPVETNANYTDKTVEEYAMMILNRGIGSAKSRTIEGYRASLAPVLKHIGNIQMIEIRKEKLMEVFKKLSLQYGKVSLKKAYNTTKMLFEEAYYNEEIPFNPFIRLKAPKSEAGKKERIREPYTDEEIAIVFEKAKAYGNSVLYPMFAVLECSGMRPGELRALEWKNVDFEKKTIYIEHAAIATFDAITDMRKKPRAYEAIGPTKSKYGVRCLNLSVLAVEALIAWRKELDTKPPAMRESKYVFPSKDGSFRSESSIKCLVQRFVKKSNIEDMGFMLYRFRHTVCTRLLSEGYSIPIVQRIMGDNTVKVILDIYNHMKDKAALEACSDYYERQDLKNLQLYKN